MARFYDSVNDSELSRVEALLEKEGIGYSLQILAEGTPLKEILVAEEDFAAAELVLRSLTGMVYSKGVKPHP
ncbi:MAG: hypothetical protein GJV46_15480 [Geobacter sp.]|nr:hypothetical protein [Geobacter sp.]